MNLGYTTCLAMYGNGQKRQHIPMLLTLSLVEQFLSDAAAAGGKKPRTVVCHDDMPLTTPRKRVDWV